MQWWDLKYGSFLLSNACEKSSDVCSIKVCNMKNIAFIHPVQTHGNNIKVYDKNISKCGLPALFFNPFTLFQTTNLRLFQTQRVCRPHFQV